MALYRPVVTRGRDDLPTVGIMPGYGSGPTINQPFASALHDLGHTVVTFAIARSGEPYPNRSYPPALARHARDMITQTKDLGINRMILIGHSMGAVIATIAAVQESKLIPRVISLCGAGLHRDNPLWLAWRLVYHKGKADRKYLRTAGTPEALQLLQAGSDEPLRYIRDNYKWSLLEGWALGRFGALCLATQARLDVYYLYGIHDTLFDPRRVKSALQRHNVAPERCLPVHCGHDPQNKTQELRAVMHALYNNRLLQLPT